MTSPRRPWSSGVPSPSKAMSEPPPASAHPVALKRYVVPTPPITRLVQKAIRWVETHTTGGMIYGRQRYGKTYAVRYLVAELRERFPGMPIFTLPCNDYENVTERAFLGDLLDAVEHALSDRGTAEVRRHRLIEYLHARAVGGGDNRVLLIADDAQLLGERQYKWLMNLHNALDKRGVSLIVFLVGQPELVTVRTALSQQHKNQIIGRFMVSSSTFRGLRSKAELRSTLTGYDEAEWPEGSGISYTAHFLPRAWAGGWRLTALAEALWAACNAASLSAKQGAVKELPMQYVSRAVEALLLFGSDLDREDGPVFTTATLTKAVRHSGYGDFVRQGL